MKRVLTAAVLISFVLLLVFRSPTWIVCTFVILIGAQGLREYLDITSAFGHGAMYRTTYLVWILWGIFLVYETFRLSQLPTLTYMLPLVALICTLIVVPIYFVLAMGQADLTHAFPNAAMSMAGIFIVMIPLTCVISIHGYGHPHGWFWLLYLFLVVWAGDIMALYVGRGFGKRLLAPRISPKKTWEGAIASAVCSTAVGTAWVVYAPAISSFLRSSGVLLPGMEIGRPGQVYGSYSPIWIGVFLSIAVNTAAQFGDLAESMLKRGAGIKDSGNILPGHGGVLDRIDALLFAAPVVWLFSFFLLSAGE